MSTYSSAARIASTANGRPAPEKQRAPSVVVAGDDAKSQAQHGFGVNGSDRRRDRRELYATAENMQHRSVRTRETSRLTTKEEGVRIASAARRPTAEGGRTFWQPQASLVPATTAPLASRISIPPLSSLLPDELQPRSLSELSLDEQENVILDDLLFVFMGFEGQYIRFGTGYNPQEEKERLTGPEFRIAAGLDPSLRDLTSSMLKMASHYISLEAFVEVQSREEFGSVNHALCAAIRKLLKDYLVLVAQLEHQLLTNDNFTLHIISLHTKPTSHMMFQLYNVAQEILKKNSILEEDVDDTDDMDDVDDIIDSLREGKDEGALAEKKVCKGGSVLGLITRRLASMSGDPAARTLLTTLLREASRPYMAMLNEWLHHGGIRDPHGEFLIGEQKSIRREGLGQDYTDQYWEKRYTIREGDVPPQLEGVKEKVLLAGKYLNVVRECGGVDVSKVVQDVPRTFEDSRFLDNVNDAYAHANSSLLTLLLTTHELPARLRSLKHYFFLDRSDFFTYFLELGASELKKPAKNVNTGKLQSLLDIVLHQPGSVAAEDPFRDDVKISINEIGLTNWLMAVVNVTGLERDVSTNNISNFLPPAAASSNMVDDKDINGFDALVLDYAVPFPLSLVVSRVTLTRYQLLFRYILSLRHLETLLVGSWTEHSKVPSWRNKSSKPNIERWKRKAWTLRARMLCFVQQLLYFCTAEVIEPNWQALMSRLDAGTAAGADADGQSMPVKRTVDELMQDHVDFLDTCLKECMLTNSKLLRINSKVTNTCTMFANYTSHLSRHLAAAETAPENIKPSTTTNNNINGNNATNNNENNNNATATTDTTKLDKLVDLLDKYETNFARHLKILLDALNYLAATETVVFLGLCARLSTAGEGMAGMSVVNYG